MRVHGFHQPFDFSISYLWIRKVCRYLDRLNDLIAFSQDEVALFCLFVKVDFFRLHYNRALSTHGFAKNRALPMHGFDKNRALAMHGIEKLLVFKRLHRSQLPFRLGRFH